MILGLEIGLLIFGLLAVFRGRMTISSTRVVEGIPARLLGLLAMAPFPTSVMLGVIITIASGTPDPIQFSKDNFLMFALIEGGVAVVTGLVVVVTGNVIGTDPGKSGPKRKKRLPVEREVYDEVDEEEELLEERPHRKTRRKVELDDDE